MQGLAGIVGHSPKEKGANRLPFFMLLAATDQALVTAAMALAT